MCVSEYEVIMWLKVFGVIFEFNIVLEIVNLEAEYFNFCLQLNIIEFVGLFP